jgi:hypothetical protein
MSLSSGFNNAQAVRWCANNQSNSVVVLDAAPTLLKGVDCAYQNVYVNAEGLASPQNLTLPDADDFLEALTGAGVEVPAAGSRVGYQPPVRVFVSCDELVNIPTIVAGTGGTLVNCAGATAINAVGTTATNIYKACEVKFVYTGDATYNAYLIGSEAA